MNRQPGTEEIDTATLESLTQIEEHLQCKLVGRVSDFQLLVRDHGLILRGRTHSYYAKQVAQEAVMESTDLPILANEIQVS